MKIECIGTGHTGRLRRKKTESVEENHAKSKQGRKISPYANMNHSKKRVEGATKEVKSFFRKQFLIAMAKEMKIVLKHANSSRKMVQAKIFKEDICAWTAFGEASLLLTRRGFSTVSFEIFVANCVKTSWLSQKQRPVTAFVFASPLQHSRNPLRPQKSDSPILWSVWRSI